MKKLHGNKLSIILPCYNEQDNIPYIEKELFPIIRDIKKKYSIDSEVLFIDDGSKDHTYNLVSKLKDRHPFVKVFKHQKNMGLGAGVRTGIKNCSGDMVITLDSDLTFHPRQIPSLLDRFNKGDVDCVIGSPILKGYGKDIPYYRIFLSKSVNIIYNIILAQRITAVSQIFRIYKSAQVKRLDLVTTGFDINAEILSKLIIDHRKIVEIPATLTTRKYGVSKINNIREIKNHIRLILKIIGWRIRS